MDGWILEFLGAWRNGRSRLSQEQNSAGSNPAAPTKTRTRLWHMRKRRDCQQEPKSPGAASVYYSTFFNKMVGCEWCLNIGLQFNGRIAGSNPVDVGSSPTGPVQGPVFGELSGLNKELSLYLQMGIWFPMPIMLGLPTWSRRQSEELVILVRSQFQALRDAGKTPNYQRISYITKSAYCIVIVISTLPPWGVGRVRLNAPPC